MGSGTHLWRNDFKAAPFTRWACEIAEDLSTEDGFRIVRYDANVADPAFLAELHAHFRRPVTGLVGVPFETEEGAIMEMTGVLSPGQPGFFATAVRAAPRSFVRPVGPEAS